MRKIKRLFLVVSAFLFAITLASCGDENRNTSTPMGKISSSNVVATAGEYTLYEDVFYNQLRNQGYNTVLNNIKLNLFAEEVNQVKALLDFTDTTDVNEYERQLFDSFSSSIYGTTSVEEIKNLKEEDLNKHINQFIDSCNNEGIAITRDECLNFVEVDEKIVFKNVPAAIQDKYITSLAINLAAKKELAEIIDDETITKDEKEVDNPHFIEEKEYENYYNSNIKTYGNYQAIIIQFNTLTEAKKAMAATEAEVGALTKENAEKFYINLYKNYYNYRIPIDETNPFQDYGKTQTKTVFTVNEDKNDLSSISSTVQNIVTKTLENDYSYLERPFNQNNKYLMVYRGKTTFDINEGFTEFDENGQVSWETLKTNDEVFADVKQTITEKLIESKANSYASTILTNRIEEAEIKIYDPLFELKFESSYSDIYELIDSSEFNNNNIYTLVYGENTFNYTVEAFYAEQAKASGVKTIFNLLSYEYVNGLNTKLNNLFVNSDDIKTIEDEIKSAIKTFEKNENAAYPSEIGLETFLVSNYGYAKEELVVKSKVSQKALSAYLSDNLFDEWSTEVEHKKVVDYSKLGILENILEAGNKKYNDIFSINIDHMLIYLDDNGDGNPDDPKEFTKYFDQEDKKKYEDALLALSQAIYAEANCEVLTKSNDLMEILNYIVEAYTKNEPLYSDPNKTWADYKKYNFLLKVESLSSSGDTTQSNVSNYVTEFGDYVKDLYDVVVGNDIKIEDDKPKFIFTTSKDAAPSSFADLCSTQFGYHMIVVNDYEERGTTESLKEDDSKGYQSNIEVLIDEKESDNIKDNIYVVVENTYNSNKTEANINQLFVYYVQKQTGATSTLESDVEEVLSAMFNDAISRYTSSNFQNYLLFKTLNVQVKNEKIKPFYDNYKGYLQRTSQSYKANDDFATWYDLDWTRPYEK